MDIHTLEETESNIFPGVLAALETGGYWRDEWTDAVDRPWSLCRLTSISLPGGGDPHKLQKMEAVILGKAGEEDLTAIEILSAELWRSPMGTEHWVLSWVLATVPLCGTSLQSSIRVHMTRPSKGTPWDSLAPWGQGF